MQLFTGKEYLKIDIANNFGLDKDDWKDRIKWFDVNEHRLDQLIKEADEPALFFAGLQAWNATKEGKPSSYPISLDATSSGIQILACLTGDRKAASLCNVIDTGHREDAYTSIYLHMCEVIGDTAKIDRKLTKQAIMTAFYSSTAVPKMVFGEGPLLDIFYKTLEERAPGAWELNEAMLRMWDPTALSNDWVLPDNFHVHIPVMGTVQNNVQFLNKPYEVTYNVNRPIKEGRSLGANMTHSIDGMLVREMTRRCMFDPIRIMNILDALENKIYLTGTREDTVLLEKLWNHFKKSGFLSARILDCIHSGNMHLVDRVEIFDLIASLPKKPFEVIAVHDCFRCLPNYGNDLRKQYNILLSNIAKSELLSFLITQIKKKPIKVGKLDKNLWKDILDADYALS